MSLSAKVASGVKISDIRLFNPPSGNKAFSIEITQAGLGATTKKLEQRKGRVETNDFVVTWDDSFLFHGDVENHLKVTFEVKVYYTSEFVSHMKAGIRLAKKAFRRSEVKHNFPTYRIDFVASFDENGVVKFLNNQVVHGRCKINLFDQCYLEFKVDRLEDIIADAMAIEETTVLNNAPTTGEASWSSFLSLFKMFMATVDAISQLNPYTKLAWCILSHIPKNLLEQHDRNDKVRKLFQRLKEIYEYITEADRLPILKRTQIKNLSTLVQQTIECLYFIRDYGRGNIVNKVLQGDSLDGKINAFNETFNRIVDAISNSIILDLNIVTFRISKNVNDLSNDIEKSRMFHLLNDLPYARDAGFSAGKRCLPGTRERLLAEILTWVNDIDSSQRTFLLSGQAGTGKSSIAHTLAELFSVQNRLGSLFCFNRAYKDRRNLLFSTISRDLADGDVLWRKCLVEIIEKTAIRTSMDIVTQFNEFIVKPSGEIMTIGPVVIIIDALDESGTREERSTLLQLLFDRCSDISPNYRLIITSRPEADIEPWSQLPTVACRRMGDITSEDTLHDIRSFVSSRLSPVTDILDKELDMDWRSVLAKRAEGLFQWASTACRFSDPTVKFGVGTRVKSLLSNSTSASSLYDIYHQILSAQPEFEHPEFFTFFKTVIYVIIIAREPLSITALQCLLRSHDIEAVLLPLHSLFTGVHDLDSPIRPLHTSLIDFFSSPQLNEGVANSYYIDTSDQSPFTLQCLQLMNQMLRFNICNLETSHRRNRDILDIRSRIEQAIPSHLSYACRFWASHLQNSSSVMDDLLSQIHTLMNTNLLYFFEVLSLLGEVERGRLAMQILRTLCETIDNELANHAADAFLFGFEFGEAITASTPHLYLSALPFAPTDSFISKNYVPLYPQLFSIEAGQTLASSTSSITKSFMMKRHATSFPKSLAFSPEGQYVATGFYNGEFWLWNYKTGEVVYQWGPQGMGVCDVVFSPNEGLVYCCFEDGNIRIWNMKTNHIVDEPHDTAGFVGQQRCFCRISPDGSYVAFHAEAKIVLYDRKDRLQLAEFGTCSWYRGSFSPKGQLFVFIRKDRALCLWDTQRRTLLASRLPEHPTFVYWTRALTDDYLAFGESYYIELWDIRTMKQIRKIWTVHDKFELYRNNECLLSSSSNTYSIWNISTGELVIRSSLEHRILSTAIAPGSEFLGFITDDETMHIRQWDTPDDQPELKMSSVDLGDSIITELWSRNPYIILVFSEFALGCYLQISDTRTMNKVVFKVKIDEKSPVVLSHQGHGVVLCIAYATAYQLCVWSKVEGELVLHELESVKILSLAFSSTGAFLISGNDAGTVEIWDVCTRSLLRRSHIGVVRVHSLSFSMDGNDRFVVVYMKPGVSTMFVEVHECYSGYVRRGPFQCAQTTCTPFEVALLAGDSRIVCMSGSGIEILDASTGVCRIFYPFSHRFVPKRSPDWHYVMWKDTEGVKLWDMSNGTPRDVPWLKNVDTFEFSNDSSRILVSHPSTEGKTARTVTIWDIQIGMPITDAKPIWHVDTWDMDWPCLASSGSGSDFVLAPHRLFGVSWDLAASGLMSVLYKHHRKSSHFGMDTDHPESLEHHTISMSNNPEILEYALIAWSKALFSDFSEVTEDGWVLGPHGELLFWVPEKRRESFWRPCTMHTTAKNFTKLNFSKFMHGSRWVDCKEHHSS